MTRDEWMAANGLEPLQKTGMGRPLTPLEMQQRQANARRRKKGMNAARGAAVGAMTGAVAGGAQGYVNDVFEGTGQYQRVTMAGSHAAGGAALGAAVGHIEGRAAASRNRNVRRVGRLMRGARYLNSALVAHRAVNQVRIAHRADRALRR